MKSSLHIGAIIYPRMDQTDLTGPFEVLSRLPNSKFHIIAKDRFSIRDEKGLILTPEETILQAPKLDLLIVPGGPGQEAMMEDEVILSFIQKQSEKAHLILTTC